ncbi:MOSC domain-containing protein [Natrarchaeobius oligotrophus]|uniref:MOSC domain-containing protein n=1 Tax=Natrarchaeobius chitinivorans TaxID=1679083 RepID=A0A3N6NKH5_NATCH|nr:MOSC domain-containing protein [Natrarchaeobius chitinivorans]RQG99752.1 MOSC domain-containing protein [Natrarchaeobius chitinivorans]
MAGRVRAIYVAADRGEPTERVERATAVADRGLEDDRYFDTDGTFGEREGCDLTLIEREALTAVEREHGISLEPGAHRRNVETADVSLESLIGRRFRVGDARCVGIERCAPCAYLERHLEIDDLREALVRRGGLRARILEGGTIEPDDPIVSIDGNTGTQPSTRTTAVDEPTD